MTAAIDASEFAGKRVLVSGGTKGLGRAAVTRFLQGGAQVITAARGDAEPVAGAIFVQADLTTVDGSVALANAALDRMGGVDILAHVVGGSLLDEGSSDDLLILRPCHETVGESEAILVALWRLTRVGSDALARELAARLVGAVRTERLVLAISASLTE